VIKGVLDARSTANGYAPGGEMLDVLWTNASFAALGVWLGVLGVAVAVPPTGKRIVLLRRAALVLAVLSLASLGLANLVYYQVYAGWPALVRNHAALSGLAEGVSIVLFPIVPAALLYRNPVLATNSAFRVTTNLLAALFPLVIAAGAWFREVPIWFAAVNVALTLLMVQICLSAVRRRWDAVEVLTGVFGLADRIRSGDREWLRWINQHLPDPDLQAEMVKAYMRNHPNQRARSLLGWACVTLATAAAAGAGRALVTSILRAFH
jgi:hypothetical protein